jgi:hypothetical protein
VNVPVSFPDDVAIRVYGPEFFPRYVVVAVPLETVRLVDEITTVPIPLCEITITDELSLVFIVPSLLRDDTVIVEAATDVCVPKAIEIVDSMLLDPEIEIDGISSMPRNTSR